MKALLEKQNESAVKLGYIDYEDFKMYISMGVVSAKELSDFRELLNN